MYFNKSVKLKQSKAAMQLNGLMSLIKVLFIIHLIQRGLMIVMIQEMQSVCNLISSGQLFLRWNLTLEVKQVKIETVKLLQMRIKSL